MIFTRNTIVRAVLGQGDTVVHVDTERAGVTILFDDLCGGDQPLVDVEKPSLCGEAAPRIELVFQSKDALNGMIQALYDIRYKTFGDPALPASVPDTYSALIFKKEGDEIEAGIFSSLDAPEELITVADNALAALKQPPTARRN